MLVKSGYDRSKKPELFNVRQVTFQEALAARNTYNIGAIDLNGNWRKIKITSVKTWKRRPADCEVHWKYGLYEYGYTSFIDGKHSDGPELVIKE